MNEFIVRFVDMLASILYIAILARVILSWLPIGGTNPIVALVYQITEPILAPLRRIVPRIGIFDLTPMIALILIGIIQSIVHRAL
jgi:YggT family protein